MTATATRAPAHVLPFTPRRGHVLLDATVDGRAATLILDTGSSVSVLDRAWARGLALAELPTPAVARGVGEARVTLATVGALRLGPVVMERETVALVDLRAVSEVHGVEIHGTVGYPLFARWVVEIDHAASALRLHEPAAYVHHGGGHEVPVDLAMRVPVVRARLTALDGASDDARLVLDLGTSGLGVMVTAPYADAHAAWWQGHGVDRPLGTGVGGTAMGRLTRLARLDVGGTAATDVVVGVARDHAGFLGATWVDGTVGAPVLGRSRVTLDYARGRVILDAADDGAAPDGAAPAPFAHDASGLDLAAAGERLERVVVRHVVAGSPAAEAGLRVGDVLLRVDDVAATGERMPEVEARLRAAGAAPAVVVLRDGREVTFTPALRRLV